MARRNISLPDDLDAEARRARLNVSALAQRAVAGELDRQERMAKLDAWLDELDAAHGAPPEKATEKARDWFESASKTKARPGTGRKPRVSAARRSPRAPD